MKIIDFEKKGNVVRFYLGLDDCENYWGDDWDDAPYDCNAGQVYSEYITGHVDVAFPFKYCVMEQADDYDRTYISKQDMKERKYPCIVAKEFTDDDALWMRMQTFGELIADDSTIRFYFGDTMNPCKEGETVIYEHQQNT